MCAKIVLEEIRYRRWVRSSAAEKANFAAKHPLISAKYARRFLQAQAVQTIRNLKKMGYKVKKTVMPVFNASATAASMTLKKVKAAILKCRPGGMQQPQNNNPRKKGNREGQSPSGSSYHGQGNMGYQQNYNQARQGQGNNQQGQNNQNRKKRSYSPTLARNNLVPTTTVPTAQLTSMKTLQQVIQAFPNLDQSQPVPFYGLSE